MWNCPSWLLGLKLKNGEEPGIRREDLGRHDTEEDIAVGTMDWDGQRTVELIEAALDEAE